MAGCPFYPQFDRSSLDLLSGSARCRREDRDEIVSWTVSQLKRRELKFSVEDPDAPENWPRVWFIWRGNALMASRKGPRVFPEALSRHTHQRHRRGDCGRLGERDRLAQNGSAGKDGPRRRPELPDGHVGALLRYRAAGRDVVREGRSELDRHAQFHPSAVGSGAAGAGSRRATGRSSGRWRASFPNCRPGTFPDRWRTLLPVRWRTIRLPRSRNRGSLTGLTAKWKPFRARRCRV